MDVFFDFLLVSLLVYDLILQFLKSDFLAFFNLCVLHFRHVFNLIDIFKNLTWLVFNLLLDSCFWREDFLQWP